MGRRESSIISELCLIPKHFNVGGVDLIKNVLISQGVDERLFVESQEWPFHKLSVYFTDGKKARSLLKTIRKLKLKDVRLVNKHLTKKDWEIKWKDDFKPFVLTRSFGVVPLWLKDAYTFRGKVAVYIDTDTAFGTGLHATTKHMAGFVENIRGRFKSFLDVGTGTGILSIIAAKCGAQAIDAIEISPDAATVARKNIITNGCPQVKVYVTDVRQLGHEKKYDFVCANIITKDLMEMADKLVWAVKPGKYLAVSGISANNYIIFRKRYARYPLRCVKVAKDDGWTSVLYQKLTT